VVNALAFVRRLRDAPRASHRNQQRVHETIDKIARRASPGRDPERTRAAILAAATQEITAKGLTGARVDEIARVAGVNKRMIYHYFGDKDGLYLAVLEDTYRAIRIAEIGLDLGHRDPVEGMRELVLFTWQYFIDHPEFLSLLATENLHRAAHLKKSKRIRNLHNPLVDTISDLLARGAKQKVFRKDVDPVELYISIASLGFFYMSNRHTLSTIFGEDLNTPERLDARGRHIVDVVLSYLRP
jgi:AcrR family transcriptional regulator